MQNQMWFTKIPANTLQKPRPVYAQPQITNSLMVNQISTLTWNYLCVTVGVSQNATEYLHNSFTQVRDDKVESYAGFLQVSTN